MPVVCDFCKKSIRDKKGLVVEGLFSVGTYHEDCNSARFSSISAAFFKHLNYYWTFFDVDDVFSESMFGDTVNFLNHDLRPALFNNLLPIVVLLWLPAAYLILTGAKEQAFVGLAIALTLAAVLVSLFDAHFRSRNMRLWEKLANKI